MLAKPTLGTIQGIFLEALKMLGKEDSALLIRPSAVPFMLPWIFSFFKNSRSQQFEKI